VNKLMQAVHRSHNAYCLHVDAKSSANFLAAAKRLAGCLGNVLTVESTVVWGETSVLLADLKCFRALLNGHRKWNYVINLTGQEYPIRTLMEMVHILKLMNGSNNMEKLIPSNYRQYPAMPNATGLGGLRWYKGSAHAIISRAAVQYIMEDHRARQILDHIQRHYARGRTIPDETYYATLNHNYGMLQFPGSYTGNRVTTATEYRQIYRYKIWSGRCRAGLSVRGICILGAADLQDFNSRPELIANKMYFDFQSDAFRCVQERFWNNTRADYDSNLTKSFVVPLSFYEKLEFVPRHHV
uniref:Protein xylosyltransferase n=1 Tax=Macrostomum lignano TaxID=282301 RepID=A0A1I8HPD4_9PLAT